MRAAKLWIVRWGDDKTEHGGGFAWSTLDSERSAAIFKMEQDPKRWRRLRRDGVYRVVRVVVKEIRCRAARAVARERAAKKAAK